MKITDLLHSTTDLAPPFKPHSAEVTAAWFGAIANLSIYPRSLAMVSNTLLALGRRGVEKYLVVLADPQTAIDGLGFSGAATPITIGESEFVLVYCPTDASNAAALRAAIDYTKPRILGLATSAGCGDRLGLATPGHIQAVRGTGVLPILAQQSMRENARTGRSPQDVIDDATWAVFQEGWRGGYGADADHLKSTEQIDRCVAAGYTFFTIDPGDHVNNEAHSADPARLHEIVAALPWDELKITPAALHERYLGKTFEIGGDFSITFSQETLARAAGKYGRAIAHTARMYRHLAGKGTEFELEMSVDETETVTSAEEHFFIASELKRLDVKWVSLAPRYVGSFEKGVDYIGDLAAFEASLAQHAAIARHTGPYKLSIHSGSDKFSVYPIYNRLTAGVVHLKTAGTSYLEALRVVAQVDPALFRRVLAVAIEVYPAERATYHVSGDLAHVADPATVPDADLRGYLDQFDARQVLHVTYGSGLDRFGDAIKAILREHEDLHYAVLKTHFDKHIQPFARSRS